VARAGQLNIIAGGPEPLLEQAQPVLDVVGAKTWYFGSDPSQANLVKVCVNFNIIHTLQALGESMALVESGGIDPVAFVNVLTGSLYPGIAYTGYGDLIANRRYSPPGFSVELGLKDLSLAEKIAAEGGVALPTAPAIRRVFEQTLQNPELRDLDWSAIAETIRNGAS
jgi:3-hydroxyisobutyrate dehydrogenase-like beta-hydroxyacid dehydrogenase